MLPVSVVILACNESGKIRDCVMNAKLISDDIIVVDSGSTDKTVEIVCDLGCSVLEESWNGYGNNKNKGINMAKYDWILSLDADEMPDYVLIAALREVNLSNPDIVYDIPFKVFFAKKAIRFGSFGSEHHIRLFNRTVVKWAAVPVHETLILPENTIIKRLSGYINHYAINTPEEYKRKMLRYATLNAQKYLISGKRATFIKRYFSPVFSFAKNYFFRLGLIDGKEGLFIAATMAWYTWLKYHYLYQMELKQVQEQSFQSGGQSARAKFLSHYLQGE